MGLVNKQGRPVVLLPPHEGPKHPKSGIERHRR